MRGWQKRERESGGGGGHSNSWTTAAPLLRIKKGARLVQHAGCLWAGQISINEAVLLSNERAALSVWHLPSCRKRATWALQFPTCVLAPAETCLSSPQWRIASDQLLVCLKTKGRKVGLDHFLSVRSLAPVARIWPTPACTEERSRLMREGRGAEWQDASDLKPTLSSFTTSDSFWVFFFVIIVFI